MNEDLASGIAIALCILSIGGCRMVMDIGEGIRLEKEARAKQISASIKP